MSRSYTIALLGQPNSGKSTLFNGLTGARQHVGNWPGKTVEKKEGTFKLGHEVYTVVDLPGAYSLSANSDEEIVTREYIDSGKADLICILADASQLERSMFMLADYIGIKIPAVLLMNMMDVAGRQGKQIDVKALERALNIPVLPFVASEQRQYKAFYELLQRKDKENWLPKESLTEAFYKEEMPGGFERLKALLPKNGLGIYSPCWLAVKLLEHDALAEALVKRGVPENTFSEIKKITEELKDGTVHTGNCKFRWIDEVLKGKIENPEKGKRIRGFDKLATSKVWGKPLAVIIILLGLCLSVVCAAPIMIVSSLVMQLAAPLESLLSGLGFTAVVISLVTDGILGAVYFALLMVSYIFGITLVFGFIEEIGYMARISYVFDNVMRKLGLHGKAVMPFLVSFGCNIGGAAGTRVLDTWGQRIMTIALSWVIPCASTWAVIGLVSSLFFGAGAMLVIISLFMTAVFHMFLTYKLFGKRLLNENDRLGLIMELPPYHRPRWKNLFRYVFSRMGSVLKRALKMITAVSVIFWALSYSADGMIENSIIYKIGTAIEPVTMWFGLRWQMFMAWLSSGLGKESSLGVLSALFQNHEIWNAIIHQKSAVVDTAAVGASMLKAISKPEALAFIYAFFFNMPCLMALSASAQETHSMKWTVRIALYYIAVSLLFACIAYHIGIFLF